MGSRIRAELRRRAHEQRGVSLIEVMITAALLSLILTAILSLSENAQRLIPKQEALAFTLRDSEVALDRMTRELRHAYALNSATATGMDVSVRIRGVNRRVAFDCNQPHQSVSGLKRCVRRVYSGATPGPMETVIPKVESATFTYEPPGIIPPRFVRINLKVPAAGDRADGHPFDISLDTGIYLRNLGV